jgi:hypothetical protein
MGADQEDYGDQDDQEQFAEEEGDGYEEEEQNQ